VLFFAAPVLFLFLHRSLVAMLESAAMISAGIACFVIANRREQHEP
jgi:predicted Zn-dependent protease